MSQLNLFRSENEILAEQTAIEMRSLLSQLSGHEQLIVFRDLEIDNIIESIKRYPKHTQKEILAVVTYRLMSERL